MLDYIIVGQGIAGSMLSWHLLQLQQKVLVIDDYNASSSSNIASGITKPITGNRFVKTWLADDLLSYAQETYSGFESYFRQSFYHSIPVFKIFDSVKAINDWSVRCSTDEYKAYLKNEQVVYLDNTKVKNKYGGFELEGATRLNIAPFLMHYRHFLKQENALAERKINAADVRETTHGVAFQEIEARKIIFCEGPDAITNPYFRFLPFQLAKGECLVVRIENFYPDRIINGDVIVLPTGNKDEYYVGATHEWHFDDAQPSVNGRNELEGNLQAVVNCKYEIIAHKGAIRPTVKDRRPFIGFHPHYPNIGIFNGMGTKGISLSPYFARHFANHLVKGEKLMDEVDIKRFL